MPARPVPRDACTPGAGMAKSPGRTINGHTGNPGRGKSCDGATNQPTNQPTKQPILLVWVIDPVFSVKGVNQTVICDAPLSQWRIP